MALTAAVAGAATTAVANVGSAAGEVLVAKLVEHLDELPGQIEDLAREYDVTPGPEPAFDKLDTKTVKSMEEVKYANLKYYMQTWERNYPGFLSQIPVERVALVETGKASVQTFHFDNGSGTMCEGLFAWVRASETTMHFAIYVTDIRFQLHKTLVNKVQGWGRIQMELTPKTMAYIQKRVKEDLYKFLTREHVKCLAPQVTAPQVIMVAGRATSPPRGQSFVASPKRGQSFVSVSELTQDTDSTFPRSTGCALTARTSSFSNSSSQVPSRIKSVTALPYDIGVEDVTPSPNERACVPPRVHPSRVGVGHASANAPTEVQRRLTTRTVRKGILPSCART